VPADPASSRTGVARCATPRRRTIATCLTLFAVGLILRLAYLAYFGIESQKGGDMDGYIALARNLVQGRGFSFDGVTPATFRPPLFSWLLGAWCYVLNSTSLETMVAFQVFVETLCAPVTYLLVRQTQRSERFALGAGLFVATYPFIFSNVSLILQEPTQMLIATALGISVVAWCREPKPWRSAIAGLLFGLGALAKSPFLLAPAITLLVSLFGRPFRRQLPSRQVVLAALMTAVAVLPWTIRNYQVSGGRFTLINSQGPTQLIWITSDGTYRPRESLSEPRQEAPTRVKGVALSYGNEAGYRYLQQKNDELLERGLAGPDVTEALGAAAGSYLLKHPVFMLKVVLRGMVLSFSPNAGPRLYSVGIRVIAMVLFHLPLALGLFAGTLKALKERNAAMSILSLFVLAYLLVHAPAAGAGGRYSVPVIPLLIAITGYSLFRDRSRAGPAPGWV
jgi:4-amino-4-deoxy-L-arabinose transferase-like glycosyltransferase